MKQLVLTTFFVLLFSFVGYSQDRVVKTNGDILDVKVIEVGSDYIKYRLYNEMDGPIYNISTSEILMIKYESGRIEEYFKKESHSNSNDIAFRDDPYKSYKELKKIYNPKEYVRSYNDRYNPAGVGVASFFIPGLGECICGEWGNGFGKFIGNVALATAGSVLVSRSYVDTDWETELAFAVVCYLGCLFIDIYSIVDAVQIAKVKNMYEQDLRKKHSTELNLLPAFDYIKIGNNIEPTLGLTLALKF